MLNALFEGQTLSGCSHTQLLLWPVFSKTLESLQCAKNFYRQLKIIIIIAMLLLLL